MAPEQAEDYESFPLRLLRPQPLPGQRELLLPLPLRRERFRLPLHSRSPSSLHLSLPHGMHLLRLPHPIW
jgi:hypothetical protein